MNIFEDLRFKDLLVQIFQLLDPKCIPNLMCLNFNTRNLLLDPNRCFVNIIKQKKIDLFSEMSTRKGWTSPYEQIINSPSTGDIEIFAYVINKYSTNYERSYFNLIMGNAIRFVKTKSESYSHPLFGRRTEYDFVFQIVEQFHITREYVNSLFEEALKSKDDTFIHFVLNLKKFDPKYNDFQAIKLTLKFKNIVVFNLLVKKSGIPESELVKLIGASQFTFHQSPKLIVIEYFDPTAYRTQSIQIPLFHMAKFSRRTDLYSEGVVKIPFPVETHVIRSIQTCLEKNTMNMKECCRTMDDFYSMLRLIEFFGFEFN